MRLILRLLTVLKPDSITKSGSYKMNKSGLLIKLYVSWAPIAKLNVGMKLVRYGIVAILCIFFLGKILGGEGSEKSAPSSEVESLNYMDFLQQAPILLQVLSLNHQKTHNLLILLIAILH